MKKQNSIGGVLTILAAFSLWGALPVYWKLIKQVGALEIITHRIIWSCLFMLIVMRLRGTLWNFRNVKWNSRTTAGILLSAMLVTANWTVYVWAVNSNHILDASLGYFINPIFAVILGAIFLHERIGWEALTALTFAIAGVAIQLFDLGQFPWAAIFLASSFAFYSLLKKTLPVGAEMGLLLETAAATPFALIYLLYLNAFEHTGATFTSDAATWLLLAGAGIITAVPLLLFGIGARKVDMTIVGFTQYISPTLTMLIGLFIYNEAMPEKKLYSFILIWIGLAIFTIARICKRTRPLAPLESEGPI